MQHKTAVFEVMPLNTKNTKRRRKSDNENDWKHPENEV